MPTNEERRAAVSLLREFADNGLWGEFSDWANSAGPTRIADLIEPEPERTCGNVACSPCAFMCSNCGWFDKDRCDFNFCPNCRAKVVDE